MKPLLDMLENRCCPSVVTVTSLADSGPGTLRAAVAQVNKDAGTAIDDTINIAVTGTIELSKTLLVTHHCTINGPGENLLTIDGQGKVRVWDIYPPGSANGSKDESSMLTTISGMTIANGIATDTQGFAGGGLFAREEICLENMCFENCSAINGGGAVNAIGKETMIENCMFDNCATTKYGGAVAAPTQGATITGTTFEGNSAGKGGGDIYTTGYSGTVTLNDDYFADSSAPKGTAMILVYKNGDVLDVTDCVWADFSPDPVSFVASEPSELPTGFPVNEIVW